MVIYNAKKSNNNITQDKFPFHIYKIIKPKDHKTYIISINKSNWAKEKEKRMIWQVNLYVLKLQQRTKSYVLLLIVSNMEYHKR